MVWWTSVLRPRAAPWRSGLATHWRTIYSESGVWDDKLSDEMKFNIEKYWGPRIQSHHRKQKSAEKFYVLSMFPYPSGMLHMGHVRVYCISDAMARFYRMCGKTVIHPMGWDAFGLPAENAAIERGEQPHAWTCKNIAKMKEQFQKLGCSFDWNREFSTCDPQYYKWTQHLFLLMLDHGLAYQKEALVNWDPIDGTVLADEQVDENGCSWRSGAKVEKKLLKQWFLRATAFSKSLWDGLEDPTLEEWLDVTKIQQHWIGKCDGVTFHFRLKDKSGISDDDLTIWTGLPEAIFGVSFIALSPNHILSGRVPFPDNEEKDRVLDLVAIHPFTNEEIPIYVSTDVPYPDGADAYLGIPGEVAADLPFAQKHGLKVVKVFETSPEGEQMLINSNKFSRLCLEEAREKICDAAKAMGCGGHVTSSKLRDWLISRQRYWGTPIPVIHCPSCKTVPVPQADLPVLLPQIDKLSGRGGSVLVKMSEWRNVSCPRCGGTAQRETDTMDTFVDSSWYYLRFLDPSNKQKPFSTEVINADMPVDLYIGGKEHAAMHLYYARFVNHFCHSLGLTRHKEPFKRLLVQGMVLGQTHRSRDGGRYLRPEEVEMQDKTFVEKATNTPVISDWEKMSKSRYNGVDPEEIIKEYGTDTTRLFMLADVAPRSDRKWSSSTFWGNVSWQHRLWKTIKEFRSLRTSDAPLKPLSEEEFEKHESEMFNSRNSYVRDVTYNFRYTYQLSVAITKLLGLTTSLRRMPPAIVCNSRQYERALAALIIMMAPITPHFASELWAGFASAAARFDTDITWDAEFLDQPWPDIDAAYQLPLTVMVNGEKVGEVRIVKAALNSLTESTALAAAGGDPMLVEFLEHPALVRRHFSLMPSCRANINLSIAGFKMKKKDKASKTNLDTMTTKNL